jgi:hypothetical protein
MEEDDPFDLEKLLLNQEEIKAYSDKAAAPKARKRRQQFTLVPDVWKKRLAEGTTNCSTYKLALALLHRDWKNDGRPVRLANKGLEADGLNRKQKYRALTDLERLGLVTVERRFRKSPTVKVLR